MNNKTFVMDFVYHVKNITLNPKSPNSFLGMEPYAFVLRRKIRFFCMLFISRYINILCDTVQTENHANK